MKKIIVFMTVCTFLISCVNHKNKTSSDISEPDKSNISYKDTLIANGDEMVALGNIRFGISKKEFKKQATIFTNNIKDENNIPTIGAWELDGGAKSFIENIKDLYDDSSSHLYSLFTNDSLVSLLINGPVIDIAYIYKGKYKESSKDECIYEGNVNNIYISEKIAENRDIYIPINSLIDALSSKYGKPDFFDANINFIKSFAQNNGIANWKIGSKTIELFAINWNERGSLLQTNLKLRIRNQMYNQCVKRLQDNKQRIKDSLQIKENERIRKSNDNFKKLL